MPRLRYLACALALAACGDFPTPAELDHAQILAIRADPPVIPAGGRARLSALVAGPDGEALALPELWEVVGLVAEAPVIGRVEVDDDGAVWYVAPDTTAGGEPALAVVQLTVDHPERTLTGVKGIAVGLGPTENPRIAELRVNDTPLGDDGVMELPAGGSAALAVDVEPAPDENTTYAWYATLGIIEPYRQPVTSLTAPDEAGEGWLFVVVRDGLGGAVWQSARISVTGE